MKKLKFKVFATIFTILTICVLSVFIFINVKSYVVKEDNITNILNRMSIPESIDKNNRPLEMTNNPRKIFMEFIVYTIVLDNNGNYNYLINNTDKDIVDEVKIKTIAEDIINNHKYSYYVGNLYFEKFAYSFTNNNLIIIDNININKELVNTFLITFVIFILVEFIIGLITYYLTRWIITPVNESFEKQKRFIADASHELKTPLAVIIASCDAYNNDSNIKWINNIKSESERMSKLVIDLLDLTYLENEKNVQKKDENLSKIIESSVLTFESIFFEKSIKLKYDIKENIIFNCNADLIKELMGILLDNAIKHSKEKGLVSIKLSDTNKVISLEVKNKGLPIKKGDEEKIFERFYKSDESRNRKDNSYGLGLAIAKNIVESHKGLIKAFSKSGYTTFKITWNQK